MKNLFDDKEFRKVISRYKKKGVPTELAERIYTSRLLGSNSKLVLHGGGNTSVKGQILDIDNVIHNVIYIKGSGSDLASIDVSGFPAVKLDPLVNFVKMDKVSDEQMVNFLRKNLIVHDSPNPSVETLVHAIIKEKYVDHTHSNAILEISNRPNGRILLNKLFHKKFIIIPYVMPGFLLSKKVFEEYKKNKNIHGLILCNHGIFTFADKAKRSYDLMIKAVNTAEKYLKNEKVKNISLVKKNKIKFDISYVSALLKSELCNNKDYIINFRSN
ncbi:class II aldolase/adducin family protein, partial [Pelagibacteraceae bacterium]|nr:class II aldolase/adducin family protein [Pelagibacteraceae bacterium]